MAVNRFVLNGMSFHGHGAINEIPGIIASKGFKKAFVASDPDLVKFGVTAKITDLLEKNGIAYEVYSNIKPNPTIENVQQGVDAYRASGADFMITIGGGSSMDTGKGIGIIVNNPEYYDVRSLEGVRQRTGLSSRSRCRPPAEPVRNPPSTMSSRTWRKNVNSSVWTPTISRMWQ